MKAIRVPKIATLVDEVFRLTQHILTDSCSCTIIPIKGTVLRRVSQRRGVYSEVCVVATALN